MLRFLKCFRKSSQGGGRRSRRPDSAALELEQLEDRQLLSVSYHGGHLLTNVDVETVYYSSQWDSPDRPDLAQQMRQLDTYFTNITQSPYMDMLGEYGVGRGHFVRRDDGDSRPFPSSSTIDDNDIRSRLREIDSSRTADANRLYVVFTPPNALVTKTWGLSQQDSRNNFFGYHHNFGFNGHDIFYAVIAHPSGMNRRIGGLDPFQQQTTVSSHELAEAATDPNPYDWASGGWFDGSNPFSPQEIGDLAASQIGTLNGYRVQFEWSNRANGAILWNTPSAWGDMGAPPFSMLSLTVATNADGRQELFGIGTDYAVYHNWQDSPNGRWSGWASLGGWASTITVGHEADGRLEVFAIGWNNDVRAIEEVFGVADWNQAWFSLGGNFSGYQGTLAVGSNTDGRQELFAVDEYGTVYHSWQGWGAWQGTWSGWASLGGSAQTITVGQEADGRLTAYALWNDNSVRYIDEVYGSGDWNQAWVNLGGWAFSISVGRNADGRQEVFHIGTDGAVWHRWQTAANGPWSDWQSLGAGGGAGTGQLQVATNADGRLQVFVTQTNGTVWTVAQTSSESPPNDAWLDSQWYSLGDRAWQVVVGRNADGRLEVFDLEDGGAVGHKSQVVPNGGFS
jgi:hypothetical protein